MRTLTELLRWRWRLAEVRRGRMLIRRLLLVVALGVVACGRERGQRERAAFIHFARSAHPAVRNAAVQAAENRSPAVLACSPQSWSDLHHAPLHHTLQTRWPALRYNPASVALRSCVLGHRRSSLGDERPAIAGAADSRSFRSAGAEEEADHIPDDGEVPADDHRLSQEGWGAAAGSSRGSTWTATAAPDPDRGSRPPRRAVQRPANMTADQRSPRSAEIESRTGEGPRSLPSHSSVRSSSLKSSIRDPAPP